jgi:hypothetical protein
MSSFKVFGKKVDAGGSSFAFHEAVKIDGDDFLVLGKFGVAGKKSVLQVRLSWHGDDAKIQAGGTASNFGVFAQVVAKGPKASQADFDAAEKLIVDRLQRIAKKVR